MYIWLNLEEATGRNEGIGTHWELTKQEWQLVVFLKYVICWQTKPVN